MNLKKLKRKLFENFFPFSRWFKEYLSVPVFILWVILWTFVLYLILPILALLFKSLFKQDLAMNDFIMLITAGFLVATLYETKMTNDKNKEKDLRPTLLRTGFMQHGWEDLKFTITEENKLIEKPLEFVVMTNMITNIKGSIRINSKHYKLIFSHEMTKEDESVKFLEVWNGWLAPNTIIHAIFLETGFISNTDLDDGLVITYDNMEGSHYTTVENKNYVQKTFKV
jgi:hypothetical protein